VPVRFSSNIETNPVQTARSGLKVILPNKIAIEVDDDFSPATLNARRWSIEDLFNQLKNRWGWKETWQQSSRGLRSIGTAIFQNSCRIFSSKKF